MAWISAAALLENYVCNDLKCSNCNSTAINLITGSELTCLACGQVSSTPIDIDSNDCFNEITNENLKPISFDKSKLFQEWKKICNQLNISDDSFLRKMFLERRRSRKKIANNRDYLIILMGSLYYIQKRNSGGSIFLDDIIDRLGLSTVPRKFAKVISEISLQLNVKIHSQSLQPLILNMINQLTSSKSVEYIMISRDNLFNPNSFLSQLINDKTYTLANEIKINSNSLSRFISDNINSITDSTVLILQHIKALDKNLQLSDDILVGYWRKYGYSSKITLAIAIHIALYKLSAMLPIKEYVTLLSINRSSFYRRRHLIQKLVVADDPIIPYKYFQVSSNRLDENRDNKGKNSVQKKNFNRKYEQLQNEVHSEKLNVDKNSITIICDNHSNCIFCRYIVDGKVKKRCFGFNRYGIQGARKLAETFKSSYLNATVGNKLGN